MTAHVSIDTNVFIYAFTGDAEFGAAAQQLLRAVFGQQCQVSVSTVLWTEMLHGAHDNGEKRAVIRRYLEAFPAMNFVPVDTAIAQHAGRLLGENKSLRIGDAIHSATAVVSGATEFWTNDRALASLHIPGLKIRLLTEFTA